MLEHKEGDSKTAADNMPLVAPGYDSNIAIAVGILLLVVIVIVAITILR